MTSAPLFASADASRILPFASADASRSARRWLSVGLASLALWSCKASTPTQTYTLQAALSGSSISVAQSGSTALMLTLTPSAGLTGTPQLSLTGAPTGVTFTETVPAAAPPAGTVQLSLTATATADAAVGTYPLVFTAAIGSTTATARLSVTVTTGVGDLTVSILAPDGTSLVPAVQVADATGANVATLTLTGNDVVPHLPAGTYTVLAQNVMTNGFTYMPTVVGSPVTVQVGGMARASVNYGASAGSLDVTITAPNGVTPAVSLTSPAGALFQTITTTGTTTVANLPVGAYGITAAAVTTAGVTYTATVNASPATVTLGETTSVSVAYVASTASLAVTVVAPSVITPAVAVNNPDGSLNTAITTTGVTTINALTPGSYAVVAAPVSLNGSDYEGTVLGSPVMTQDGQTAQASVSYVATTGALTVTVVAMDGETPAVHVNRPDGTRLQDITATTTFSSLPPGFYTVTADEVFTSTNSFTPALVRTPADVEAGQIATATVTYAASTGNLTVVVAAPDGETPVVKVLNPDGSTYQTFTSAGTFNLINVPLALYTVSATPVALGGFTYAGAVGGAAQNGQVTVGPLTDPEVTVTYAATTGVLNLTITAASGETPSVTLTDAQSNTQTITGIGLSTLGLTPGSYTLAAAPVSFGGYTYSGQVSAATVVVTAGMSTSASAVYSVSTGSLSLNIQAPGGEIPSVAVTGPAGYAGATITQAGAITLSALPPGTYNVVPAVVTYNGYEYSGALTFSGAALTVTAGQTTPAAVAYAPLTGTLSLTVAGPSGITPEVTVQDQTGHVLATYTTFNTFTLTALPAGAYTVSGPSTTLNGYTYTANLTGSTTIVAGQTTAPVIAYAPSTGTLTVQVAALDPITPAVVVTNPDGSTNTTITTTGLTSIPGLPSGYYGITASPVTYKDPVSGATYSDAPQVAAVTQLVSVGTTQLVSVNYGASTGALQVSVTAADGETPQVMLSDSTGDVLQTITTTGVITVSNLTPGTYSVSAQTVTSNGYTYAAGGVPASVTVVSDATATPVDVVYAPTTGTINLTVTGPSTMLPSVTVTDAHDNVVQTLITTGPATISGLAPGTYAVAAASAIGTDGFTYAATATPLTVVAGQAASETVAYTASTGTLTVTVNAPAGVPPSVAVDQPGGSLLQAIGAAGTTTLTALAPGAYAVTASNVTVNGYTYQPTVITSPASVTAGVVSAVTVSYAATTGTLIVIVSTPVGVTPSVAILQGTTTLQTITTAGPTTITGLAPGSYTVTANNVTASQYTYTGTVQTVVPSVPNATSSQAVTVSDATTVSETVTYAASTGILDVTLVAPTAVTPAVAVTLGSTPVSSITSSFPATTALTGLVPGSYDITAATVTGSDSYTYAATTVSTPTEVQAGLTSASTVTYAATSGTLTVTVLAPMGVGITPVVTVSNPDGSVLSTINSTQTFTGIAPGFYGISGATVSGTAADGTANFTYTPAVTGSPAQVIAGQTGSASVNYGVATGALSLTVTAPAGMFPAVAIQDPHGAILGTVSHASATPVVLADLLPGTYSIVTQTVTANGYTYVATGSTAVVSAGGTATATVTYAATTGALDLTVNSPAGVVPSVTVALTGQPAVQVNTNGLTALNNLAPGSYVITASSVGSAGHRYDATGATVTVSAGQTTADTVTYGTSVNVPVATPDVLSFQGTAALPASTTVAEGSYSGIFSETDNCNGTAAITATFEPPTGLPPGPSGLLIGATPEAGGACVVTVTDAYGQVVQVVVKVTTVSVSFN